MNAKMKIDDIARELGVSKTTVSRAISGKGRISEETRKRVQSYIQEQHFAPNAMARSLAHKKTYNLAVVFPTDYEFFDLPYFSKCMHGISDVAGTKGYDILMCMIEGSDLTDLKRIVENSKADGYILTRTLFQDPVADYLKVSGQSFVVMGSSPDQELVQVDNDHFGACRELTSILLGKGLKHLALLGREGGQVVDATRRKGFEAALREAGIRPEPSLMVLDDGIERKIPQVLDNLLAKGADAIVCMNEKLASAVLLECRVKNIPVPGRIRLASFYNSSFLANSTPAVTAIDIDDRLLGAAAARTLLAMIEGEVPGNQLLRNYQVILRESTA